MKKVFILLTLGFFVNVALAQSTDAKTKEQAKTEKTASTIKYEKSAKSCNGEKNNPVQNQLIKGVVVKKPMVKNV